MWIADTNWRLWCIISIRGKIRMTKKSKMIISVIGVILFVAIIATGVMTCYLLNENSDIVYSSSYVDYLNLPYIMQDNAIYLDSNFFKENDLIFKAIDDKTFDSLMNEVRISGECKYRLSSYFIDLTGKNESVTSYSFSLIRKEDSDKIPIEIQVNCCKENLLVLVGATKYGDCKYKKNNWNIIQAKASSNKYSMSVHLDIKKGYNYTKEEQDLIEESIIKSIIDNIITYDEIIARGGV